MAFWMYLVRCADESYYAGHTDNLEARIAAHQSGEIEGYTATRLPVELVFAQDFQAREEALAMERRVKGWNRAKKAALIRGDWNEIVRLSNLKAVRPSTSSGRTG